MRHSQMRQSQIQIIRYIISNTQFSNPKYQIQNIEENLFSSTISSCKGENGKSKKKFYIRVVKIYFLVLWFLTDATFSNLNKILKRLKIIKFLKSNK